MTLFQFSVAGSVGSLVAMALGFLMLARAKKFVRDEDPRTSEEKGSDVMRANMGGSGGGVGATLYEKSVFKGKGVSAGFSAEISTREVVEMLKQGRIKEASPWLVAILGAIGAAFFWPLLVMVLCGADPLATWGLTAFFFGFTLYAAWPRKD